MPKYKIFISYRRKGGYDTAKLIYDRLRMDGYSVSFDLDTLENGNFDNELEKRIKKCKDFIIILNPGIFDCFSEEDYNPKDDWVRIEIACALASKKNIVPLMMEDFAYPRRLPNDIKDITRKNSIDLSPKHFEAAYEKMKSIFLTSKPHWRIRHKKRVRAFISIAFLLFAAYLFFTISSTYKQKELEAAEAKIAAQRADSIRIAKEMELIRTADSINAAKEEEIARATDSISDAMEEEIARATDSIAMYMRAKAAREQSSAKSTPQSPQKKTTQQATVPQKSSKKTLHWGGSNDKIGQVIFDKISVTGVKKTKCLDNGVIVKINKPACKAASGKTTCSYSPKMILTSCSGKILSLMDANTNFKTSPQANEAKAKEELASELRRKSFSDWISAIRNIK